MHELLAKRYFGAEAKYLFKGGWGFFGHACFITTLGLTRTIIVIMNHCHKIFKLYWGSKFILFPLVYL